MLKNQAELIMSATLAFNEGIGGIDQVISQMTDENEKKVWVQKLGGLMEYIYSEIQLAIMEEYPALEPYQNKEP